MIDEDVLKNLHNINPVRLTSLTLAAKNKSKDLCALMAACLVAIHRVDLLKSIWTDLIDGEMLCLFVKHVRSGVTGRGNLGTAAKKLVCSWFNSASCEEIFRTWQIEQKPSIADILKITHPRPESPEKEALFGWILGKDYIRSALPLLVRQFEQSDVIQGDHKQ